MPAIPEILMFCLDRGRHKLFDKRSDMKDADEALSRIARASTEEPSGALTRIRHVMSSEPDANPMAAFEDTGFTGVEVTGLAGGVVTGASTGEGVSLLSTCNKVWWGFWHFLQR